MHSSLMAASRLFVDVNSGNIQIFPRKKIKTEIVDWCENAIDKKQ